MNAESFDGHFADVVLDKDTASRFLEAIHAQQPVGGLTHSFYRYPARRVLV
jgi:hypothetical protein